MKPSRYTGPEAVEEVLNTMPPKNGGIGVGTIEMLARRAGWEGTLARGPRPHYSVAVSNLARDNTALKAPAKFRPITPDQFSTLPLPAYLVGKHLPAQAVIMIYGPPASYKTFIALEWAFQIATGHPTGFGFVVQGAVAYCAGEAPFGIARFRFAAWMQDRGIQKPEAVPFVLFPGVPLVSTPSEIEALIAALEATGMSFSLIVIDTVARALGGLDENSAKDAGLLLAAAERLRHHFNCSVLLIHHTGKDEAKGARGSSALLAGVDAAFEVKADPDVLAVTLRCEKMKEADPPAAARLQGKRAFGSIVFDPIEETDYAALTRTNTSVHNSDVAAALRAIEATGGNTVTTHALAFEMAGKGADEKAVSSKERALQRASRNRLRAYVSQLGEGRGVPTLWTLPDVAQGGSAR